MQQICHYLPGVNKRTKNYQSDTPGQQKSRGNICKQSENCVVLR